MSQKIDDTYLKKLKFMPLKISVYLILAQNQQCNSIFLYLLLLAHRNSKTYECYPSINTLAAESGCDKSTIKRHIKILADLGLIQIHSGTKGYSSHYYFPYEDGYKESIPTYGIRKRKGAYHPTDSHEELDDDEIDTPFGPVKKQKGIKRVQFDNGTMNPDEKFIDENGEVVDQSIIQYIIAADLSLDQVDQKTLNKIKLKVAKSKPEPDEDFEF